MLRMVFSLDDLARTRLALSPLWEVVASIQVLRGDGRTTLHRRWMSRVRPRLTGSGVDLGLLFELVSTAGWYTPDFLAPPPRSPVPDLTAELLALRATPAERVRADLAVFEHARRTAVSTVEEASGVAARSLGEMPAPSTAAVAALYDDPAAGLDRLADQVRAYWDLAIGPYWGRIRRLLEDDVLYRSRRLADGGAAALFADLAPNVSWRRASVEVRHRRFSGTRHLDGRGLLLTPSAFVWPTAVSAAIPPWQPSVTYPARGVGTLWEEARSRVSEPLSGVLGRSRAALLVHLDGPRSTTDLAARLGVTPGGVSQHLGRLRAAGLVTPHRVGHTVLYARTAVADALLASETER